MNLAQRLAARLRELRERAGISQVQMARRLGIGRSTLNRLEMASQNITISTLDTLCRALRCDIADLFPAAPPKKSGSSRPAPFRLAIRLPPTDARATADPNDFLESLAVSRAS